MGQTQSRQSKLEYIRDHDGTLLQNKTHHYHRLLTAEVGHIMDANRNVQMRHVFASKLCSMLALTFKNQHSFVAGAHKTFCLICKFLSAVLEVHPLLQYGLFHHAGLPWLEVGKP